MLLGRGVTYIAMNEPGLLQEHPSGLNVNDHVENGILELIRLVKEQNHLLRQLQTAPRTQSTSASASSKHTYTHEPASKSGAETRTSLLAEPMSQKWGSLSSFLRLSQHEDGPTKISSGRGETFLEQAKYTFHRIMTELSIIRGNGPYMSPKVLKAFEKQLSAWPGDLFVDESLGLGRVFPEDSNIYIHESSGDGNNVSFGSVWYVSSKSTCTSL